MGIENAASAGSDMVVAVTTAESLASMGSDKSNANFLTFPYLYFPFCTYHILPIYYLN